MRRFQIVPAAVALTLVATPVLAGHFAIDFDNDGDPATVNGAVTAEVGDIVEAYLVAEDFLTPWPLLWGLQFGLDATPGLELIGLYDTQDAGAMMHDGSDGIAIAYAAPFDRNDLPIFVARFLFRVLSSDAQTVELTASTGWGETYEGVVWSVSSYEGLSEMVEVEDAGTLASQKIGRVNPSDQLPTEPTSWGKIKKLYTDDTI